MAWFVSVRGLNVDITKSAAISLFLSTEQSRLFLASIFFVTKTYRSVIICHNSHNLFHRQNSTNSADFVEVTNPLFSVFLTVEAWPSNAQTFSKSISRI